jgi:hypothetical protein
MEDTTWEDEDVLRSQFPFLSLEGKASVPKGGTDRYCANAPSANDCPKAPVWIVYDRKGQN